jgi:hypothetical protein
MKWLRPVPRGRSTGIKSRVRQSIGWRFRIRPGDLGAQTSPRAGQPALHRADADPVSAGGFPIGATLPVALGKSFALSGSELPHAPG